MRRLVAGLCLLLAACASKPPPSSQPKVDFPAPPPTGGPADLMGLSANQLQSVLGAPTFSRKENGSEMWRYDNRQCRVFFFLYPGGPSATKTVRHVETVPRGKDAAADASCLAVLRGTPASQARPSS